MTRPACSKAPSLFSTTASAKKSSIPPNGLLDGKTERFIAEFSPPKAAGATSVEIKSSTTRPATTPRSTSAVEVGSTSRTTTPARPEWFQRFVHAFAPGSSAAEELLKLPRYYAMVSMGWTLALRHWSQQAKFFGIRFLDEVDLIYQLTQEDAFQIDCAPHLHHVHRLQNPV